MAAAVVGWSPVTTTIWMPASVAVVGASRMPSRMGSAKPISATPARGGPVALRPPRGEQPQLPAGRRPRRSRCQARRRTVPAVGQSATPPARRARTRPSGPSARGRRGRPACSVTGSAPTRSAGSVASPPSSAIAAAMARRERPGVRPLPAAARRPPRPAARRRGSRPLGVGRPRPGRPVSPPGRDQHVDHRQPVLGQRAGLVGQDQVDGPEGLLGVQPPNEHAAAEQPVGAQNRGRRRAGSAAPRGSRRSRPRCPPRMFSPAGLPRRNPSRPS